MTEELGLFPHVPQGQHDSICGNDGSYCLHKTTFSTLTQFSLFSTKSRFFLVGKKRGHDEYHVLKIDRCSTLFGNPVSYNSSGQPSSASASSGGYGSGAGGDPYQGTSSTGGANEIQGSSYAAGGSSYAPNSSVMCDGSEGMDGDSAGVGGDNIYSESVGTLPVVEDPNVYTLAEITKLFSGCTMAATGVGLLGFVRLLAGYYIVLATRRRRVGDIEGKAIYTIEGTSYIPIESESPRNESHYKTLLLQMDLTNNFYFSYEYNLSRSLQFNMKHCCKRPPVPQDFGEQQDEKRFEKSSSSSGGGGGGDNDDDDDRVKPTKYPVELDDTFVWNTHFIKPMLDVGISENWILPVVHGYYGQESIPIHGQKVTLSLIARRSRFCAGPRFFKRGISNDGHVANDVEVEQILVNNMCGSVLPVMSSYVQVRGSIPLFWSQDKGNYIPKPNIYIDKIDPFYNSTIRHFQDLFRRYGSPVTVLNMVKSEEKKPRESILLHAYTEAVEYINQSLPQEYSIRYHHWDFHRAKRRCKGPEYLEKLVQLTMSSLEETKIFCTRPRVQRTCTLDSGNSNSSNGGHGPAHVKEVQPIVEQHGVLRCNCIDSLDRTNAAQFSAGRCALACQLFEMGIIDVPELDGASSVIRTLLRQYERMGDSLAEQYGGSGLANTMDTYTSRSLLSQGRDVAAGLRRYYRNSFTDPVKQQIFNLFLGVYVPSVMHWSVPLWNLDSDYQLHNPPLPRNYAKIILSSVKWWEYPLKMHSRAWVRTNRNRNCEFDENPNNSDLDEAERKDKEFDEKHKVSSICSFDQMLLKAGESVNWVSDSISSPNSKDPRAAAGARDSSVIAPASSFAAKLVAAVSSMTGGAQKKGTESPGRDKLSGNGSGGNNNNNSNNENNNSGGISNSSSSSSSISNASGGNGSNSSEKGNEDNIDEDDDDEPKVGPMNNPIRNGFDLLQTMQDLSQVNIHYEDTEGGSSAEGAGASESSADAVRGTGKGGKSKRVRVVVAPPGKDEGTSNSNNNNNNNRNGTDAQPQTAPNRRTVVATSSESGASPDFRDTAEKNRTSILNSDDGSELNSTPPNSPSSPPLEEPRRRSLDVSSFSSVRQKYATMYQRQQQQQQQQVLVQNAHAITGQRPVVIPTIIPQLDPPMTRKRSLSVTRKIPQLGLIRDDTNSSTAVPTTHHFPANPLGVFGVDVNKCSDITSYLSYLDWKQQLLDFSSFKNPSKDRDYLTKYLDEWEEIKDTKKLIPPFESLQAYGAYKKPIAERSFAPSKESVDVYLQSIAGVTHDPEWKDQINK